jgi:hypothetical protein
MLYVLMNEYKLDEIPIDEIENITDEVAVWVLLLRDFKN